MGLFDRFVEGENKIPVHPFFGALHLVLRGKITRGQLVAAFNLDDTAGNDKDDLDTLQSLFAGKSADEKKEFYDDLKAVMYLWESEKITKTQAKALIGV